MERTRAWMKGWIRFCQLKGKAMTVRTVREPSLCFAAYPRVHADLNIYYSQHPLP